MVRVKCTDMEQEQRQKSSQWRHAPLCAKHRLKLTSWTNQINDVKRKIDVTRTDGNGTPQRTRRYQQLTLFCNLRMTVSSGKLKLMTNDQTTSTAENNRNLIILRTDIMRKMQNSIGTRERILMIATGISLLSEAITIVIYAPEHITRICAQVNKINLYA